MTLKPRVALSQDFLLQLAKLPLSIHSKVTKWAIQFQSDPTSPGINYENIKAARDPNLKSVRLDRDWRGIVFKPSSGDVYVLLYVDHHDAAYRWAENRRLAVNPVTGAMQMVILESVTQTEVAPKPAPVQADAAADLAVETPPPREADKALLQKLAIVNCLVLGCLRTHCSMCGRWFLRGNSTQFSHACRSRRTKVCSCWRRATQ